MSQTIGDTLYFDADDGTGRELWAHDTSNHSTWQVSNGLDVTSIVVGQDLAIVVGDTLYFDADGGNGAELWAHDTSNGTTWQVADIYPGTSSSRPGMR